MIEMQCYDLLSHFSWQANIWYGTSVAQINIYKP